MSMISETGAGAVGDRTPRPLGQLRIFRLAFGLFSEPAALQRVLAELPGEVGGTASTARPTASVIRSHAEFRSVLEAECWFLAPFRLGTDAEGRTGLRPGSATSDSCPDWMSEAQCRRLEQHLRDGGFVLILSSSSPAQHDAACRALLRLSQHGVQTYDFTSRY